MQAAVGDRIVIASGKIETPVREGEVVGLRHEDGSPPYVVRWLDGHEGLFYPGADALVRSAEAAPAEPAHVHTWRVEVQVVEREGVTSAHAVLRGGPGDLDADGTARRNPADTEVARIGDEIAVARALRRLADALVERAESDVSANIGADVHLTRT